MTAYTELERRFRRLSALSDAASMLHWDSAVHMPAAAAPARAEQLTELKLVRHEILTADDLPDLIDAAEEQAHEDPGDELRGQSFRKQSLVEGQLRARRDQKL